MAGTEQGGGCRQGRGQGSGPDQVGQEEEKQFPFYSEHLQKPLEEFYAIKTIGD